MMIRVRRQNHDSQKKMLKSIALKYVQLGLTDCPFCSCTARWLRGGSRSCRWVQRQIPKRKLGEGRSHPKAEHVFIFDSHFACNFAHKRSDCAGKSVGLLHLQTPAGATSSLSSHGSAHPFAAIWKTILCKFSHWFCGDITIGHGCKLRFKPSIN